MTYSDIACQIVPGSLLRQYLAAGTKWHQLYCCITVSKLQYLLTDMLKITEDNGLF